MNKMSDKDRKLKDSVRELEALMISDPKDSAFYSHCIGIEKLNNTNISLVSC